MPINYDNEQQAPIEAERLDHSKANEMMGVSVLITPDHTGHARRGEVRSYDGATGTIGVKTSFDEGSPLEQIPAADIANLNYELLIKIKDSESDLGDPSKRFPIGAKLIVERSDHRVDSGWMVRGYGVDAGEPYYILVKRGGHGLKRVPSDEVERLNNEQAIAAQISAAATFVGLKDVIVTLNGFWSNSGKRFSCQEMIERFDQFETGEDSDLIPSYAGLRVRALQLLGRPVPKAELSGANNKDGLLKRWAKSLVGKNS